MTRIYRVTQDCREVRRYYYHVSARSQQEAIQKVRDDDPEAELYDSAWVDTLRVYRPEVQDTTEEGCEA